MSDTESRGHDLHMLRLAIKLAQSGTCARRQVGCVVTTTDCVLVAFGYNGRPHALGDCRNDELCPDKNVPAGSGTGGLSVACYGIHAEERALQMVIGDRRAASVDTLYCSKAPCTRCVLQWLETSLKRIVFSTPSNETTNRELWEKAGREWVHLPECA